MIINLICDYTLPSLRAPEMNWNQLESKLYRELILSKVWDLSYYWRWTQAPSMFNCSNIDLNR